MKYIRQRSAGRLCAVALWLAIFAMGLGVPLLSLATNRSPVPSRALIEQHIVAECPATAKAECMETADLLSSVSSLYEIIIVVLIALLALVASLVYLSIRASSRRQIEEQFQKEFESDWLQSRLEDKVRAHVQQAHAEYALRLSQIELAVKAIRSRDDSEDRISEKLIIVPE